MRYALSAFALIVAALAGGCTTTNNVSSTLTPSASSGDAVRIGSRVYVYSFIDVRVAELGPAFMQAFERMLAQQLLESGVESQQLWYGQAPVRSLLEREGASSGSTKLPVSEVVTANREKETKYGSRYRLVVIPSEISPAGTSVLVRTRWDLYDPKTNRSIWTGRADTIQTFWGANVNEGAEERAQKLVTAMVAEMKRVGLL
jgi:hypothetical protein